MKLLSSLPEFQEIPEPFLLNGPKHHMAVLSQLVRRTIEAGSEGLQELVHATHVLGNGLMDMYHGALPLQRILREIRVALSEQGVWELNAYTPWIQEGGGFRTFVVSDGSKWILYGTNVEGRHIHVHPARYSPSTSRIRGNAIKTAVMVVAHARLESCSPLEIKTIDAVRTQWLKLSPIGRLDPEGGLHKAISHLWDYDAQVA